MAQKRDSTVRKIHTSKDRSRIPLYFLTAWSIAAIFPIWQRNIPGNIGAILLQYDNFRLFVIFPWIIASMIPWNISSMFPEDNETIEITDDISEKSLLVIGLLKYGELRVEEHVTNANDSDICKLGSLSQNCFKPGDGRLGENPALTSLHIVFLRLHNNLATRISTLNPNWSEEKVFQETRRIVGALIQQITYREYLPIVVGHEVMRLFDLELLRTGYFEGYDPIINPNIANEFATAAYRFGHSLVQKSFMRFDRNHQPLPKNVTIHEELTNLDLQSVGSLEKMLLGLVNQPSQKIDEFVSEELTNHLFEIPPSPFGMDLISMNIQRGRDHGIAPYTEWRQPCGLPPINNWGDLESVMETSTIKKLRRLYSSVEDIDLFPAGLSEKPVPGGLVGPTFACIIAQQFSNLRKGDRFWFENSHSMSRFTPQQLQQIRSVTLAQILCETVEKIESIQPFVMLLPNEFENRRVSCEDRKSWSIKLQAWKGLDESAMG